MYPQSVVTSVVSQDVTVLAKALWPGYEHAQYFQKNRPCFQVTDHTRGFSFVYDTYVLTLVYFSGQLFTNHGFTYLQPEGLTVFTSHCKGLCVKLFW